MKIELEQPKFSELDSGDVFYYTGFENKRCLYMKLSPKHCLSVRTSSGYVLSVNVVNLSNNTLDNLGMDTVVEKVSAVLKVCRNE